MFNEFLVQSLLSCIQNGYNIEVLKDTVPYVQTFETLFTNLFPFILEI